MISYIKGILAEAGDDEIVVEAGSIGYTIHIPLSVRSELPPEGEEVKIYTYLQVREDAFVLFGFLTKDDLEIYRRLLGVSGVGPKAALSVLGVMSADDLRFAILGGDAAAIARAPGLGQKTAQKIILELKDKVSLEDAFEKRLDHAQGTAGPALSHMDEAVQALTALGYSASEALHAVRSLTLPPETDPGEILRQALKKLL
mgnify:CR=1 FL=1